MDLDFEVLGWWRKSEERGVGCMRGEKAGGRVEKWPKALTREGVDERG